MKAKIIRNDNLVPSVSEWLLYSMIKFYFDLILITFVQHILLNDFLIKNIWKIYENKFKKYAIIYLQKIS